MSALVIWGCGGHAREVNLLCEQAGLRVAGFLDERPEMRGRIVDDVPVLGALDDIRAMRDDVRVVTAGVGDPSLKRRFAAVTIDAGFRLADPVVHPGVHVSRRSSVGPGAVICAGVVVTVNVRIGAHVILNHHASVAHDVVIGDFATISPGANLSGNVMIGEGVFVGTNAAVRERISIGAGAVVAGGAFVREDVPARVLVAGVPATVKKRLS